MRLVGGTQYKLGQVRIDQITLYSEGPRPHVLYELKHLYCELTSRKKIFEILEERLLPDFGRRCSSGAFLSWAQ